MATRTKNLLWRIYAYVIVALVVFFVGMIVLTTKTMKRDSEIFDAVRQMYAAERLVMHVDDSLNLCYNLGFIPYPLNYYIGEEAWDVLYPR